MPAAGYELRTIRVEGLSRTNPLRAARAVLRAGAAVGAAHRILAELRPAAVLGGGGYVAGPVGLAALARRIPLVLTEADSHLGITNRLLAPRARRVCLAFPIEGRSGGRYVVTGRPVPAPGDRCRRRAGALRHRTATRPACSSSAARWARGRSTRRRCEAFARRALSRAARRGHARPRRAGTARRRRALRPAPVHRGLRRGARRLRPVRRARRRLDLRDRGRGQAGDPRPLSARQRRPPDRQRALDGAGGRRGRRARRRADGGAPGQRGRRAARRPVAAGGDGERVGGAGPARGGAGGRRRGARRGRGRGRGPSR